MTAPPLRPFSPDEGAAEAAGDLPEATYLRMGTLLRVGLVIALSILAGAILATVARAPASPSGSWIPTNPLLPYLDPRSLARGLGRGAPVAYLTVGVYALIATPVVRVIAGTAAFHRHRERAMTAVTAAVLALLLLGIFVVGPLVR